MQGPQPLAKILKHQYGAKRDPTLPPQRPVPGSAPVSNHLKLQIPLDHSLRTGPAHLSGCPISSSAPALARQLPDAFLVVLHSCSSCGCFLSSCRILSVRPWGHTAPAMRWQRPALGSSALSHLPTPALAPAPPARAHLALVLTHHEQLLLAQPHLTSATSK